MVSEDTMDAKYTQMSLAVAKDSGWYVVDMGKSEHYFWGKNEGCHIFEETCSTANASEFCHTQFAQSCNDTHLYQTSCSVSNFGGGCKINLNFKSCKTAHTPHQDIYYYGPDAACLNTRVRKWVFY